jgi:hypothetical protein
MLRLLKIVSLVVVGAWSLLRTAEEGLAFWVRRATRPREAEGLAWA